MEIIPPARMIPYAVNVIIGTTSSSVSDLQTQYNDNVYEINEENDTPGIDLRILFKNVLRFSQIMFSAFYDGRAAHYVEMQLYNYETSAWETYTTLELGVGLSLYSFDCEDYREHIDKGNVIMRFEHPPTGVPADDLHVGYAALLR